MQTRRISLLTVLALLGLSTWGQAQTAITTTTITEPVTTTGTSRTVIVASATGISAGVYLLLDNDVCRVGPAYVSGTSIPVLCTGRPTTHGDNTVVHIFPIGATVTRAPQGSCTRGSGEASYALTLVVPTGTMARCGNGPGYPAGTYGWVHTDVSSVYGQPSATPPQTP